MVHGIDVHRNNQWPRLLKRKVASSLLSVIGDAFANDHLSTANSTSLYLPSFCLLSILTGPWGPVVICSSQLPLVNSVATSQGCCPALECRSLRLRRRIAALAIDVCPQCGFAPQSTTDGRLIRLRGNPHRRGFLPSMPFVANAFDDVASRSVPTMVYLQCGFAPQSTTDDRLVRG